MSDLDGLRLLYGYTAHLYEQNIVPAFGPLARDLADWIIRCTAAHLVYELHDPFDLDPASSAPEAVSRVHSLTALDIGTGTGILARTLAETLQHVVGLDQSSAMLRVARQVAAGRVQFATADLHHLPFRRGAVQLVASTFGMNASTPKKALRSIASILRPGEGILAFQEWGAEDDCSRVLDEALKDHTDTDLPAMDAKLRSFYESSQPWFDQLQYIEDYYEMLKEIGFDLVWVKEAPFTPVHLPSVDTFLTYKLSWPMRRFALEEMSEDKRAAYFADARDRLRAFANPDGTLDWSPPVFRVFATL